MTTRWCPSEMTSRPIGARGARGVTMHWPPSQTSNEVQRSEHASHRNSAMATESLSPLGHDLRPEIPEKMTADEEETASATSRDLQETLEGGTGAARRSASRDCE